MEINQRLSERLSEIRKYGTDDIAWANFVRDHKDYIKRKSKLRRFLPEELIKYRYRPQEFYTKESGGPIWMTWIFLFINDIREQSQFNENRLKLYVPGAEVIEELHQIYASSANQVVA